MERYKVKIYYILSVCIACIFLFGGCSEQKDNPNYSQSQFETTKMSSLASPKPSASPDMEISTQEQSTSPDMASTQEPSANLDNNSALCRWVGVYTFEEVPPPPPTMFMSYNISIYNKNGNYYSDIKIDGQMTVIRAKAIVVGDETKISLIFDEYLPEISDERYEKGDVLLSFKRDNSDILTEWGKLKPMLPENQILGMVYFKK